MSNTAIINEQTTELNKLILQGIDCWVKAGEILVTLLDRDGMSLDEVAEATDIQPNILQRFEQLGRKQLMPELLMASYPASKCIQKLPYSEQKRVLGNSVEVLMPDNGDKLNISTKNLTSSQCRQVFSPNSVRDLAGQKAWVESNNAKNVTREVVSEMPYHIDRNQVFFDKGCSMKASQLINILAQLTPKK